MSIFFNYGSDEDDARESRQSIYELLERDIADSDMTTDEKNERLSCLVRMREKKANIMFVGATGSGKSSTINALFDMDVAKVGVGVNPETDSIESYTLDNLTIWDTPGLGDGVDNDEEYNRMLVRKLKETDSEGKPLIDLVMVVLDASSKDLGTSYDLINKVIIPCLGEEKEGRILVALNQADVAMKGKHWNAQDNVPDEVLLDFLKKKAESVKQRIYDGTGVTVEPVFYSAGYKENDEEQCRPYNLTKLLYYIIKSIPKDKRFVIADNINPDSDMWLHDDDEENYADEIQSGFLDSMAWAISDGARDGKYIGENILGIPGRALGYVLGGAVGAVKGFFQSIFG